MMPPASDEPLHADTDATVPDVTEHRDLTDDPDATVGEQQQPPDSPDQTIDDNGDPELTIGAPLHSGDVDDETIYADIEQTIEQQWRDSFTDETTPELTIKCDPQQTMIQGFEFSLKLREVSRHFRPPRLARTNLGIPASDQVSRSARCATWNRLLESRRADTPVRSRIRVESESVLARWRLTATD